ncbi:hypothetical protein, partial [Streptomyces clavuligerus]
MYELSRVRLYSIGPAGARYADTVLDLRGVGEPVPNPAPAQAEFFAAEPVGPPRRPAPAGVLFLENGGGKSVLLKLIFSVMLPGHRNTLGGASSGVLRKFLLADDCGHVALEWQHTLTGELVVVGKVSEWRGRQVSNDPRKFAEAWYSFRPGPGLSLDSLPVAESTAVRPSAEGSSGAQGRRRTMKGFRDAITEAGKFYPHLDVVWEEIHDRWNEHLGELGLDPELFRYQREMNADEGEAAGLFAVKKDSDFTDLLLRAVTDTRDTDGLADLVSGFGNKLGRRAELTAERDFTAGSVDLLGRIVEAAESRARAREVHTGAERRTRALARRLAVRAAAERTRAADLAQQVTAAAHTVTAADHSRGRSALVAAELAYRHASLALTAGEKGAAAQRRELIEARTLHSAWQAAEAVLRHRAAGDRSARVAAAIREAERDAAPALAARARAAADLVRALHSAAEGGERLAQEQEERSAVLQQAGEAAHRDATAAATGAQRARSESGHLRQRLAEVEQETAEAVRAGWLDDTAPDADPARAALAASDAEKTAVAAWDTAREAARVTAERSREATAAESRAELTAARAADAAQAADQAYEAEHRAAAAIAAEPRLAELLSLPEPEPEPESGPAHGSGTGPAAARPPKRGPVAAEHRRRAVHIRVDELPAAEEPFPADGNSAAVSRKRSPVAAEDRPRAVHARIDATPPPAPPAEADAPVVDSTGSQAAAGPGTASAESVSRSADPHVPAAASTGSGTTAVPGASGESASVVPGLSAEACADGPSAEAHPPAAPSPGSTGPRAGSTTAASTSWQDTASTSRPDARTPATGTAASGTATADRLSTGAYPPAAAAPEARGHGHATRSTTAAPTPRPDTSVPGTGTADSAPVAAATHSPAGTPPESRGHGPRTGSTTAGTAGVPGPRTATAAPTSPQDTRVPGTGTADPGIAPAGPGPAVEACADDPFAGTPARTRRAPLSAEEFDRGADDLRELLDECVTTAERQLFDLRTAAADDARILGALGDGGLLPPGPDVLAAVEFLGEHGIPALPGWRYLAQAVAPADHAAVLAARPELVDGVVITDPASHARARAALAGAALLPRSTVAVGTAAALLAPVPPQGDDTEVFLVPPNPAMHDEHAADEERQTLRARAAARDEEIRTLAARLAGDRSLAARIGSWRADCPPGMLTELAEGAAAARTAAGTARAELAEARTLRAESDEAAAEAARVREERQDTAQRARRAADALAGLAFRLRERAGWQVKLRELADEAAEAEARAVTCLERARAADEDRRAAQRAADDAHRTARALRAERAEIAGAPEQLPAA